MRIRYLRTQIANAEPPHKRNGRNQTPQDFKSPSELRPQVVKGAEFTVGTPTDTWPEGAGPGGVCTGGKKDTLSPERTQSQDRQDLRLTWREPGPTPDSAAALQSPQVPPSGQPSPGRKKDAHSQLLKGKEGHRGESQGD